MKLSVVVLWMLSLVASITAAPPAPNGGLVVSSPEEDVPKSEDASSAPKEGAAEKPLEPIKIYSMHVISEISSRYSQTVVSSRVANPSNKAQEVTFSVLLPDTAFISGFKMELEGKVYEAYVKEKEDAKKIYQQAVDSGKTAAHVTANARDSNHFTVAVNVEANSKGTFNLTYEELLARSHGVYDEIINLNPGQIIDDLSVEVHINENRPITTLRVPQFRSGNEIDDNEDDKVNEMASIVQSADKKQATIRFNPTAKQQIELRNIFKEKLRIEKEKKKQSNEYNPWYNPDDSETEAEESTGITGQFVVQYDVEHDPQNGEVLIFDGYFAHFFAPSNLKPLNKHVIFVLDVSGSMAGRKIDQLKEAMLSILDSLNVGDHFSITEFDSDVTVYNLDNPEENVVFKDTSYNSWHDSKEVAEVKKEGPLPMPFPVTPEYIAKAKEIIKKLQDKNLTNISEALKIALRIAAEGIHAKQTKPISGETSSSKDTKESLALEDKTVDIAVNDEGKLAPEPIIIFLTDGGATAGETRNDLILKGVDKLNSGEKKTAIFSLGFGDDADRSLLQKLSLRNDGFFRNIYEAADAAKQLTHFYQEISSPLLAGVKFVYPPDQVEEETVTTVTFPTLFLGSEIVVAGKLKSPEIVDVTPLVSATSASGPTEFRDHPIKDPELGIKTLHTGRLNRLWAYLRIKQLLNEKKAQIEEYNDSYDTTPKTSTEKPVDVYNPEKEALALSLKFSFVTDLTSLVVVKPDETSAVNAEAANSSPSMENGPIGGAAPQAFYSYAPMMMVDRDMVMDMVEMDEPIPLLEFATTQMTAVELLEQYGLDAYPWLNLYIVDDHLELPINGTTIVLKLEIDQTTLSVDSPPCSNSISGGTGVCKYITTCASSEHALETFESYSKFYCSRNGYAGVCCSETV